MRKHILVVGGYGHVGQKICQALGELYPGHVIAAGRSFESASRFSQTTDGKVKPLQLDIRAIPPSELISEVRLVIMCLDQTDTAWVDACLRQGIHYVDVSASGAFLSQVEQLHGEAAANGAIAVLGVGLAPGLTNLLARYAAEQLDQTEEINIAIMLGMGDQHGKAAIAWTVEHLNSPFHIIQNNSKRAVASFTDGRTTDFGEKLGRRKAYRFNFADQHSLPRTLHVPTVSTRLCFDSSLTTGLLAGMRRIGLFNLLKLSTVRHFTARLFSKLKFGQALFAVKVDARGIRVRGNHTDVTQVECFLQGKNEADITAAVAAEIAKIVYESALPHGVFHSEQLFALERLLPVIEPLASFSCRTGNR